MLPEVVLGVAKVSGVVDAWPGRAYYLAREDVEMSEAVGLFFEWAGVLRTYQTWVMGCAMSSVPGNSTRHCSHGI